MNSVAKLFALVSRHGQEVERLRVMIADGLMLALAAKPKKVARAELPCAMADEIDWYYRNDESTWVTTDVAGNLPLKARGKGRKHTSAYLGFQISMMGEGIALPGNEAPLLHVFLRGEPIDLEEVMISFPPVDDAFSVVDERLLYWGGEAGGWDEVAWQFSVRVMALSTPKAIHEHCVAPALALLCGAAAHEALPDTLTALVKYPPKAVLLGE